MCLSVFYSYQSINQWNIVRKLIFDLSDVSGEASTELAFFHIFFPDIVKMTKLGF